MPRFFSEISLRHLSVGEDWVLPERIYHHAVRVRRLRARDSLTLFDGSGGSWRATLQRIDKSEAVARIDAHDPPVAESDFALTLALATIAADRMDWALQKGTELGVRFFQPIYSARSSRMDADKQARRTEHWRGVMIAACEQCGRNTLPVLLPPQEMEEYLRDEKPEALRIIFDAETTMSLSSLLNTRSVCSAVSLLTGPEGGFTEEEIAAAKNAGWQAAHLGPRILRAETAAVAASALVQSAMGDMRDRDY